MLDRNTIHCADIFDLCGRLDPQSVDMVMCDLPYGSTALPWDVIIPFAPMWDAFKRIIKPRGAIVLTASQPFTSLLVCSNLAWFRYEAIWEKSQGTGYLNANRQPMKNHENILVFSENGTTFNPIMRRGAPYVATRGNVGGFVRDKTVGGYVTINDGSRYPLSVLPFNSEMGLHPTQKPVALFEYLISTHSNRGDLVFGPCVGSGTTALAARNCGRDYICGDSSPEYIAIAQKRLDAPYTLPLLPEEQAGEVYETKPFELEG